MNDEELGKLKEAAEAATQGPWAYTVGCGATVIAGIVVTDEPGHTAISKDSFTLFEIEPDGYPQYEADEEDAEQRAFLDSKFIALANPTTVLYLIGCLGTARNDLANVEEVMGVRQNHYREEIARLKAANADLISALNRVHAELGDRGPHATPEQTADCVISWIHDAKHPVDPIL